MKTRIGVALASVLAVFTVGMTAAQAGPAGQVNRTTCTASACWSEVSNDYGATWAVTRFWFRTVAN